MNRQPAVADRFYPGDEYSLNQTVQDLLKRHNPAKIEKCFAIVSPHAGYVYSGSVCAETMKSVDIPETVVILGPNHHGRGAPVSLSNKKWQMPWGDVPVDENFISLLDDSAANIEIDEFAHQHEHSLEVQIPFLHTLQNNLTIVPLVLSYLNYSLCEHVAEVLANAIRQYDKPVLMVASSDMNHYESRQQGSVKDRLALDQLKALNPQGLYDTVSANNISMCGIIPVTIALLASISLGADTAEIIRYCDSGDVSGDTDQVVGYAGAVIHKT
jgi:AmmeMemoRadiSam system protein B